MRFRTFVTALLAIAIGCWLTLERQAHAPRTVSAVRADTIVAAELARADVDVEPLLGTRVWIRGDLVRLGVADLSADFGVTDASGIARLHLAPELASNAELVETLRQAHEVEVTGTVERGSAAPGQQQRLRVTLASPGDLVLRESAPYELIAQVLAVLTLIVLVVHLFSRQRNAERRAEAIEEFNHELNRREEILKAVSWGAERFLRSEAWETSLPEALERIGRAAEVTRVSVYTISRSEAVPTTEAAAEWIDDAVAEAMGPAAASDLDLANARLPRWRDSFLRNEIVMGSTPSLPDEEREYLESRGIRSIIAIPVRVGGDLGGLLLLTDHRTQRDWPTTERETLTIAAGVMGAAIERRRAEAALAEAEDRFRQMAEHIREVFFMTDARTYEVLYLSPAYEEVWGRSRQETIANPLAFVDSIVPEDRHLMLEDVGRSASGGGPAEQQFEYRIRRPDGAIRWIRNRSFRIFGEDGRPRRVVGVCTDITEQKQLEEELRRASRIEAMGISPRESLTRSTRRFSTSGGISNS